MTCAFPLNIYGHSTEPGWNAGLSIAEEFVGDCHAVFVAELSAAGIVFGFTPFDTSPNVADIQWGIQFQRGMYRVLEGGTPRTIWLTNDVNYEFIISRVGDRIYYQRNNTLDGTSLYSYDGMFFSGEVIYVSELPSAGPIFLDSSFYGTGDKICLLSYDLGGIAPESLFGNPTTIFGRGNAELELPLPVMVAAGSEGATETIGAMVRGYLPLVGIFEAAPEVVTAYLADDSLTFTLNATSRLDTDPEITAYVDGELPLVVAEIAGSVGATATVTAYIEGYLPLSGTGQILEQEADGPSGGALEGVYNGKLYLDGFSMDGSFDVVRGGGVHGYLTLEGSGATARSYDQDNFTRCNVLILLTGVAIGDDAIQSGTLSALELPLIGVASGSRRLEIDDAAVIQGDIPLVGQLAGQQSSILGERLGYAALELPLIGDLAGSVGATNDAETVLDGQLGLTGYEMEGSQLTPNIVDQVLYGELPFEMTALSSAQYNNYFQLLLPELSGTAGVPPVTETYDVTEEIIAYTALQVRYTNMVNEFIRIATDPKTFTQRTVNVADIALATIRQLPQFALTIAEQYNITGPLQANVIAQLAEQVLASGSVQSITQAVAAILAAITVSDNKVNAGGTNTGGGAVLDYTGTAGDPADVVLTGFFPAGTYLGLAYNTDAGGDEVALVQLTEPKTFEQAADTLVALLNTQTYISAVHTGGGFIEIYPAGGATTVTL